MENHRESDFTAGIPIKDLPDGGTIEGKIAEEDVIVTRRGDEFFAVGAHCTHYGGPLAKGLIVGEQLRCPLHHACFNLRTGESLRAPAFDAIPCRRVERIGDKVFVREKLSVAGGSAFSSPAPPTAPDSVIIVGGGAAGLAAADVLRRSGYDRPITMISADDSAPYDRPNLSKDYLAGTAPDEWIPLRPPEYYFDREIQLVLKSRVTSLDARQKRIETEDGKEYRFGAILLATGAAPIKLAIEGASDSRICYLRTYADARALIAKAMSAKQIVVVGASFIGLEVAASLRERGVAVHVVAPEKQPLERVMGAEVGRFVRKLHEDHGVTFHLGETVKRVDGPEIVLSGGEKVAADFLVAGVGVQPSLTLAQQAGLNIDRGILVNEYLETSVPGIFAAGDIARWPDAYSGKPARVEHWVVAERQGQTAARNILGYRERFEAVPFFWTSQYGVSLKYVGHAEKWDSIETDGSLEARDCAIRYKVAERTAALVTISRDPQSLQFEAAMERSARASSASSPWHPLHSWPSAQCTKV